MRRWCCLALVAAFLVSCDSDGDTGRPGGACHPDGTCDEGAFCHGDLCVEEHGGEPCESDCEGRQCGPDPICGESCGSCPEGQSCSANGRCEGESIGGDYVLIPAGTFTMGSPEDEVGRQADEVQHEVTISRPFLLKTTEVTQGEWRALFDNNPSLPLECGDDCPVNRVTWWEALMYCNRLSQLEGLPECYEFPGCNPTPGSPRGDYGARCPEVLFAGLDCLGYRLPTEAEWEYAYRAGTTSALYNGDLEHVHCEPRDPSLDAIAWYCGNAGITYEVPQAVRCYYSGATSCGSHPVGLKQANPWGLFDMAGNAAEWTWDWLGGPSTAEPIVDPMGPDTGTYRITRGGSWLPYGQSCRAAGRSRSDPDRAWGQVGFRPARTVAP